MIYNFLFSFSFHKPICISIDVNIRCELIVIKLFFENYRENASEKRGGRGDVRAKTQQATLCLHPPSEFQVGFPPLFLFPPSGVTSALQARFHPPTTDRKAGFFSLKTSQQSADKPGSRRLFVTNALKPQSAPRSFDY